MRTRFRLASVLFLCTMMGACAAGPQQLRRSVDDWDHQVYVNSPWLNVAMWVVPVFPVCHAAALAGDLAITNPWHFWTNDAWNGNGTGFRHIEVTHPNGAVDSLMMLRGGWTRVNR